MAFNPFNAFRKHQKVVFAALTIVCMLTFVMAGGSFAGGDFFSELTRWIGGGSRLREVATIYGKRISDRELQELRLQRRLANDFMQQAVLLAQQNISLDVQNSLSEYDPAVQNQLQTILQHRSMAPYMPSQYLNNLRTYLIQLQIIDNQLETAKKPVEQVNRVRLMLAALGRDFWLFHTPKDELYPDSNLYFGGSTSEQGLLDFLIWRQQADHLGIVLTMEDVVKQYQLETFHSARGTRQLLKQLGAGEQMALAALADEFRVRMAQAALVGYDAGGHVGQVPSSVTPYEFWEYYVTNRTELSLKVLPVPVEKFISEIKDQPSEAELQALFDKYKDEEYDPAKDTPGFKQPRRLKLEWISASADSDFYRRQAQQCLQSLVAATPGNPLLALALFDPLINEYETLKWGQFRAPALAADFAQSFYSYRYFRRPENVAAVVGQIVGTAGAQGLALAPVLAYESAAAAANEKSLAPIVAAEGRRRLPLAAALFSAVPSIQPGLTLAGLLHYGGQYLPMELVEGELIRKFQEKLASTLLASSLETFKTELETVRKEVESKKTTPADAEKRVEKAAQDHGWARGATSELADQYQINRDPKELAPLKEAYTKESQFRDPKGKQFAQNLFFNVSADRWKSFTPQELAAGFSLDANEKRTFLYWKTDDQPAKVLTFAQARPQVEVSWRKDKARALAEAKAAELAKQARETHGDYLPILNEASKNYGTVFELTGVARWAKPGLTSRAQPFAAYQPYEIPDDKIEYPPPWPNFVDPLLTSLRESGDATVISNRPKDVYYVVALARRDPPSIQDYKKDSTNNRQLLLGRMELDRQKGYRTAFLEQLRMQAHLSVNEEGLQRLKERPALREE